MAISRFDPSRSGERARYSLPILFAVFLLAASLLANCAQSVSADSPQARLAPQVYQEQGDPAYHTTWDGQYGGTYQHLAVQGNYVFFLHGPSLVMQISLDPPNTTELFEISRSEWIQDKVLDLAVSSSYAYLALDQGGVAYFHWDSTGFLLPSGSVETPRLLHLRVAGNYLYGHTATNLLIYSLAQPAAPALIADIAYPEGLNDIQWLNNRLYLALGSGLTILNVTNPVSPSFVESYNNRSVSELMIAGTRLYATTPGFGFSLYDTTRSNGQKFIAEYQLPVYTYEMHIISGQGDYIYIDALENYNTAYPGPLIFRIQIPLAPQIEQVGQMDSPNSARRMAVFLGRAVTVSAERVALYDLSLPDAPMLINEQLTSALPAEEIVFNEAETHLYLANGYEGIARVSVSSAGSMSLVAERDTPGYALGITHYSGYVYVADQQGGLRVYTENLAFQRSIAFLGAVDTLVSGGYLYVANIDNVEDAYPTGLYVFNVSNPSNPVLVGSLPIEAFTRKLAIKGNYLYIAGKDLRVIDISNPAAPQQVAQLAIGGTHYGMVIVGDYLYVTHTYSIGFRGGFAVFDIADPANPIQLSYTGVTGTHVGNAVYRAPYLFFRVFDAQYNTFGLYYYDVSLPSAPCQAGYFRSDFNWGLAVNQLGAETHIFLPENGIKMIGLDIPAGTFAISGKIVDEFSSGLANVAVSAGTAYTTQTDSQGDYQFAGLAACRYPITPQKARYSFVPATRDIDPSLIDASSVNFDALLTTPYQASGTVLDANSSPISGVTISDEAGHSTQTGIDGSYTLTGLTAGAHILTAALTGYTFTPPNLAITLNGPDLDGQNFTGHLNNPLPALISVEPGSHQVDGSPLVLTINGNGFVPASVLRWNGADTPTQFFSDTLLRAVIDTSAFTQDQNASLTIYNPWPGGGESNALNYAVYLPKARPVQPVLECVDENSNGEYSAYFSFINTEPDIIHIPTGVDNQFNPAPAYRGQPVDFVPGTPPDAFSVNFDGQSLTWYLDGLSVTASSASPRCLDTEPDPFQIKKVSPDHGKNGLPNDINIHGDGLLAETQVYLVANCPDPLVEVPETAVRMASQWMNDLHIRGTVPADQATGDYGIIAANPGGAITCLPDAYTVKPDEHDDLYASSTDFWSGPAVLRANTNAELGLVLHRSGGNEPASNIIIRFYLGEKEAGGQLIGEANVNLIEKNNYRASSTVTWAIPNQTGQYTLYAYIDPDNHFASELDKTNNVIHRQVTVEPLPQDTTPPQVLSMTNQDGLYLKQPSVNLQVEVKDSGTDPVSGPGSIYLVEYEYNQPAAEWVQVQVSGWMRIKQPVHAFKWGLVSTPGLHFLQVWAADKAGNISTEPASTWVNYQPDKGKLAMGLIHLYREDLNAGDILQIDLTSTNGDADLYLWRPDNTLAGSSIEAGAADSITYTATEAGIYQIEIYGYENSEYELSITRPFANISPRSLDPDTLPQAHMLASKAPPGEPMIVADQKPYSKTMLSYPGQQFDIFLPWIGAR